MHLRTLIYGVTVVFLTLGCLAGASGQTREVRRYVRFEAAGETSYGIVEGDRVRRLDGCLFGTHQATDQTYPLADVKLLVPTQPSKVLALAGNYASHLAPAVGTDRRPAARKTPELFFKVPSCLIADGEQIVIPPGTNEVHHESELVLVIGKRAKDVPVERRWTTCSG